MLTPQITLASENQNANETKINFNIQKNIVFANGYAYPRPNVLADTPHNQPGYEPVKSEEEKKREAIFARWRAKQPHLWKNLPQGKFTINASAYTAAADECGKSDGITASGLKVKEKQTIACPPQFPFGAKIKIEGYGTYVCEDRGGAIKGNKIDIYVETKKEAFSFGRRNLEAQVVS
jgi:3D (Asp-Asp-Asp) domain-containing protein